MVSESKSKTVVVYSDEVGNEPYSIWLNNLRDDKIIERIRVRVRRLENGLFGDCKPVGEGILELRLFFGAGYRIYFGEEKITL